MVLAMSRPHKHPRTGTYWFRARVPTDLVAVVGRREVTRTLGTKNPSEAKVRWAEVRAEFDTYCSNLRCGPRDITEREAHEFASYFYDQWLSVHRDNPSQQTFWDTKIGATLWSERVEDLPSRNYAFEIEPDSFVDLSLRWSGHIKLRDWCRAQARAFLAQKGIPFVVENEITMAKAIGAATQRASLDLERAARGEFLQSESTTPAKQAPSRQPMILSRPEQQDDDAKATAHQRYSLKDIVEGWWREAQAAGRKPSTYESYRNTFAILIAFLGHDDAGRVGRDDVIRFKDHRLTTPSAKTGKIPAAKTVKDSDLSALKAVFDWAVMNGKITDNPAAKITIKLGKQAKLRDKGFTDPEAKAILAAALAHQQGKESPRTNAAKRWVPWLCAFTGARVGEIAQLRKEDVTQRDGHWIIRITPEAGTVKTNEAREVALHPQLISLGFPAFVLASAEGHLFLTPAANGIVLGPLQGLKNRLSEFARAIVPDPNVAPFHGWRHRFATIGMDAGIPERILNTIQGHAPRSVADTYGHVTMKIIAAEIGKLPAFDMAELNELARDRIRTQSRLAVRTMTLLAKALLNGVTEAKAHRN